MLKDHKEGFTYLELVLCVLLVGISMSGICANFITVHKMKSTSETLEEATKYGENLMLEVKRQLLENLKLYDEKEAHLITHYSVDHTLGIQLCLEDMSIEGKERGQYPLEKLLIHFDLETLRKTYEIDKYAYEVAIWPLEGMDLSEENWRYTKENLKYAAKWYSHEAYQFENDDVDMELSTSQVRLIGREEELEGKLITSAHVLRLTKEGLIEASHKYSHMAQVTPKVLKEGTIIKTPKSLKQDGKLVGLMYTTSKVESSVAEGIHVIQVDIRDLLREKSFGSETLVTSTAYDTFTLAFINETSQDQIIRMIRSMDEEESLGEINNKVKLIVSDKSTGKTTVENILVPATQHDFLITIVVRALNPVVGDTGKVVKKMVDIYSYNPKNTR